MGSKVVVGILRNYKRDPVVSHHFRKFYVGRAQLVVSSKKVGHVGTMLRWDEMTSVRELREAITDLVPPRKAG